MTANVSSKPGKRVTVNADRCAHDLPACVKCGTAIPGHLTGRNRHWPNLTHPRYGREWPAPVAARAGRRSAGRYPSALRGAKSRGQWSGHPLGLPTEHGRLIVDGPTTSQAAQDERKRRRERARLYPRTTRAQLAADLREDAERAGRPLPTRTAVRDELRARGRRRRLAEAA